MTIIEKSLNEEIRQDAIILPFIFYITMARSLNSRCDLENCFFTCDLPEDAILLILKVKIQTGNHTLVEDMEQWTEKIPSMEETS